MNVIITLLICATVLQDNTRSSPNFQACIHCFFPSAATYMPSLIWHFLFTHSFFICI